MLMPKKVKHRKWQRGRGRNKNKISYKGSQLAFGSYGLKAMQEKWLTSRQIEAARRAMTRSIQRGGMVWVRVFPDKPVTKKGAEVPMGKGKGSVDHFIFDLKPGRIVFEMDGVDFDTAKEAMRLAAHKLPVKTKFVYSKEQ